MLLTSKGGRHLFFHRKTILVYMGVELCNRSLAEHYQTSNNWQTTCLKGKLLKMYFAVTLAGDVQSMKPVQLHRFHILFISRSCIPLK